MALNFGNKDLAWQARIDTGPLNRDAQKTQSIFGKLGKQIAAAGIFAGLTAAATKAIGTIISVNREFEKSISTLSSLTGAVGEDLEFYRQAAIEFGSSTTQSATQVSEAFKLVGSQRPELLQSKEALAQVTREAITLSEAAGIDVPSAAKAITTSLNQMGAASNQSSQFIDILANGAQLGAADINFLNTALERSGKVGRDSNLAFNELVGALELLAPAITEPANAGNQLSSLLLTLQKNGKGFESGAFDLKDALVEVQNELAGIEDPGKRAEREIQLFGQANITAGKTLTQNIDNFDEFSESLLKTGTGTSQAATNIDNLDGNIARFNSAVEGLILNLNSENGLNNALSEIVKFATQIIESFTSGNGITEAFNDFLDSINEVIEPISEIVDLLSDTSEEGNGVASVMDLLGGIMRAVTLPIEIAAKAVGGLLNWLLEFEGVRVFIEQVGDKFRILVSYIKDAAIFLGLINEEEKEGLHFGQEYARLLGEQILLQAEKKQATKETTEEEINGIKRVTSESQAAEIEKQRLFLQELEARRAATAGRLRLEREAGVVTADEIKKTTAVFQNEYDKRTDIVALNAETQAKIEAEKERQKQQRLAKTANALNAVFAITADAIENSGDSIESTLQSVVNALRDFAIQTISIQIGKAIAAVVADSFEKFGIKGLVIAPVFAAATKALLNSAIPKFSTGAAHDLSGGAVIPGSGTRDNQIGLFMPNEVTLNPKQQANLLFNMAQQRDSGSPQMISLLQEQNKMLRNTKTLIEKDGSLWQVDSQGKLTGNRIL